MSRASVRRKIIKNYSTPEAKHETSLGVLKESLLTNLVYEACDNSVQFSPHCSGFVRSSFYKPVKDVFFML